MIREENPTPAEVEAIREVNLRAFGQPQEANLVDALRRNGALLHSLIAEVDGHVVGHISYSPVSIGSIVGAGLAPMSVLPEHQRKGIGSDLVRTGNDKLKHEQCPFIIVVGHPEYYPKFGFERASPYGITSEWDLPAEAFMILILDEERMRGVSGQVKYRQEFSTVT